MIDVLFILLNFAILIGLIAYGAYRYFLPMLRTKVQQEKTVELNLHDEHHNLLIMQRQVDESIVEQESDCTNFLHKINQWREVVETHKSQKAAEERYFLEESEKKVHLQSQYHAVKVLYQQVTPFVINKLETEARDRFADERAAHEYLQHVLKPLRK